MRSMLVIAVIVLGCSGCTNVTPPHGANDTDANTKASYLFQGDLTAHGGSNCFYYCP